MLWHRYLDCLDADAARLREVVRIDLTASVPTCPGWSVADLARHVGAVYLHKVAAIRDGAEPEQWPPPGLNDEDPLALLDRAYDELRAHLTSHPATDPAGTWYDPDQTVGFWIRRMAQETVIHRIDGEIATGQPVLPVPDDLAVDGIDELLRVFVAYGVSQWPGYFAETLAGSPGQVCEISTDGIRWRVRTEPGAVTVLDGEAAAGAPEARVSGPPGAVLRWLWNRVPPGEVSVVRVEGSAEAVDELRRCVVVATQ